ncbi:MAG TPA: hypothetical protein VM661_18785 [Candidatus Sulfotelmatobacter sp.]|jgi:hypothetical protein|nr:hypothetical protein [Candidatus Sulfotelmatobacter sp.]
MNEPMVVSSSARSVKRLGLGLLTGMALLATGGCSLFEAKKPDQPPCPRVSVLADAAQETRFRAGKGHDLTDVELEAQIANYKGSCFYDFDKQEMSVIMQIGIDAKRGPAAQGRKADLSYFVAIPAFYPKPEAKIVVPVALAFPDNSDRVRYTDDEVQMTIPIKKLRDLAGYEIFVGLQLPEDELEYNRSQKAGR